jgi:hypothetical protein
MDSAEWGFMWDEKRTLLIMFIAIEHFLIIFKAWLAGYVNDKANNGREDMERNKGVYRRDMERK